MKKSWIDGVVNIKLRILSAHRRVSSRIIMVLWFSASSMSMSRGISRRAGETGDEIDIVRVSRFRVGRMRAMRWYCF